MTRHRLGQIRRAAASLGRNLLWNPLANPSAAKRFAGAAMQCDFEQGVGRELPVASIHAVVPEIAGITWTMVGIGWSGEAPYLCSALVAIGGRVVLEIGTCYGRTTVQLAANAPPGGKVYTVDLPPTDSPALAGAYSASDLELVAKNGAGEIGRLYKGTPYADRVVQLLGDSATLDYPSLLDGQPVDLAFIDGGHIYEQVRADTERVLPLMRPGGVVFWHDYQPGCPGVCDYLHELAREHPIKNVHGTELAVLRLPTD
jgi:hypothetical protein